MKLGVRLIVVLAGGLATARAWAGPVTYTVIATSGQSAPGLSGITFEAVADPRVDDLGRVVFWSRLAGTGVTTFNDGSLWTTRTGPLSLLLREDSAIPGGSDLFVGLGTPAWSGNGKLGLTASIGSGAFSFPTTLAQFVESGPSLSLVVRETVPLPIVGLLSLNDFGAVVYRAGDGSSLFSTRSGAPLSIVKTGDPAPGASSAQATFLLLGQPAHNALGGAAYWATVTYPGQTVPESGIWSDASGLQRIARTGQQAPGLNAGVVFAELDSTPRIDAAGSVAFWARLSGPGVTASNDGSVWRTAGGVAQIIAREGESAPGLSGLTIAGLARHVQASDSGVTLFWGSVNGSGVDGTNNSVIWSNDPLRGLGVVAREGTQVPELPAGVVFGALGRPGITPFGRTVFTTGLRSAAGLAQTSTFALIATDGRGRQFPIARTGDAFAVGAGDTRTISQIVFDQGDPQTGYAQYNSTGTLVFKLGFTGGSSALVAARIALCLSDFNSDGFSNGLDFDLFSDAFVSGDVSADLNGDSFINGIDFDLFAAQFEAGC